MNTKRLLTVLLALGGAALCAGALSAQDPPNADDPVIEEAEQPTPEEIEEQREALRERIRVMRAWRLTETLELSEEDGLPLFDRLDTYDETVQPLQARLEELGRELRDALQSETASDEDIAALTDEIMTTHLLIEEARVDAIRGTGDILSSRQQALLMLFLPEFDREIRENARQVRRSHRRRVRGGDDFEEGGRHRGPRFEGSGRQRGMGPGDRDRPVPPQLQ
ncbi:MAG: hypothetical protein KC561_09730 [Myxococcales bacterium]|nr:hypothetical protein [Myxococcales bacterium]